jgi:Ca2+-binding RTX toxin-like protein
MTGGTGNDTFSFLSDFGKDVITDFNAGSIISGHDTINFHADPLLANFASVNAKQVGANSVITQGANTLTLVNVVAKSLIAADFTFV